MCQVTLFPTTQIDALKSLKPKEVKPEETKLIKYDFYVDKMAVIQDLSKRNNFYDLTYVYKSESAPISFIGFKDALHIFKSIYNGNIALDVEKYKKNLNQI